MADNIFNALTAGVVFNKRRFKTDVERFTAPASEGQQRESGRLEAFLAGKDAGRLDSTDSKSVVAPDDPEQQHPALAIHVTGGACPPPIDGFEDISASAASARPATPADTAPARAAAMQLLRNLAAASFQAPTAIQRAAIPCLLAGQDVYAIAPTGSGKTLAFLIPGVLLAAQHREQDGPSVLVLSHTRELAAQTARVLQLLLPKTRLRAALLSAAFLGAQPQRQTHLLIATPLLLVKAITAKKVSLNTLKLLVLDEADKLFEANRGFLQQVDSVLAACADAPDLCRCLFSATLPTWVEEIAGSVLQEPTSIVVGAKNTAASTVQQRLLFVGREEGKLVALRNTLVEGVHAPVLVFVATKERATDLRKELLYDFPRTDCLHSDQGPALRAAAVAKFRRGDTWMLIATDLVGRGMDFVGVNTVINYDFPRTETDYIHRVGRTGRAGRSGQAVTLFTEEDGPRLKAIAAAMQRAGCVVSAWMLRIKPGKPAPVPAAISARAAFEKRQRKHKLQIIQQSKEKQQRKRQRVKVQEGSTGA